MFDVVIVGGGPAGCAAALALRGLGVERVVVLEATDYSSARVGESIPPDCRLLFQQLGLWQDFVDEGHDRCLGSCSSWGSDELGYNDFLVNPHGDGWHLDRARFDRWLASETERCGAEVCRETRLVGLGPGDPIGSIRIDTSGSNAGRSTLRCRFVVDATGRQARVARSFGARPHIVDHLVCVAGYFDAGPGAGLGSLTMLEAVEHGWWYGARLPGGRMTAAVASDASIVRSMRLTDSAEWLRDLSRTRHVGPALDGCRLVEGTVRAWAAPSVLLDPPAGTGWLAVGDAASAYDPISSQGIYKALADGLTAGPAIVAWLDGDTEGIADYRNGVAERFLDYLSLRSHFYGVERRWEDAAFWRQRRSVDPGQPRIHTAVL